MDQFTLKGLGIALITPFTQDNSVDYQALATLIERNVGAGVDYIVVLGTTGEAAILTPAERKQVTDFVVRHVDSRVPLVLGMGGNCTRSLIEEIQATDLSPFAAILSVVPFYNKPSQEGLYQHYMAVADASPVPVILYNVPGRTGLNMTPATTLRLARDHRNIIGIKEASGNLNQAEEIIKSAPEGFDVVSGDDALAFPFICMGASGVISVIGNAYPATFGKLVRAALAADMATARELQQRFDSMFSYLFLDGNPAGIKCLLADMDLIANKLRLPLTPCGHKVTGLIKKAMEALPND